MDPQVLKVQGVPSVAQCTLLSSVHGRDRRTTRGIRKVDLEAVKRFGKCEEQVVWLRGEQVKRLKFTYMDTILITDSSGLFEVTSYVKPIEIMPAPISEGDRTLHGKLQKKLLEKPSLITSHTLLIVDRSASMRTCDVENFKERIHAVYGTIALDIVGNAIDARSSTDSDVVSLIEFSETATLIFDREPVTNCLFNKFVTRLQTERPSNHGFFLAPLKKAIKVLKADRKAPTFPISVIFLSDGKPSDCSANRIHPNAFISLLHDLIRDLVSPFGARLSFTAIGFAGNATDFRILENMVDFARHYGAVQSRYVYASGVGTELSSAMSSVVTQTQETRVSLLRHGSLIPRVMRKLEREEPVWIFSVGDHIDPTRWTIYPMARNYCWMKLPSTKRWDWMETKMASREGAEGVAIRNKPFARGGERVVYQLVEIRKTISNNMSSASSWEICSGMLCAKEPLYEDDETQKEAFHGKFGLTHYRAQSLANKFTSRVRSLFVRHKLQIENLAQIQFIACTVYEASGAKDRPNFLRGFLAEPLLDHSKYQKWNGNNGYVQSSLTVNQQARARESNLARMLEVVLEENEDEQEWDDSDGDGDDAEEHDDPHGRDVFAGQIKIALSEYPQAFSHWSYRYTNRQALICDLQGVFTIIDGVPTFRMTDPVIHGNFKGQRHRHGRTDHGLSGIIEFFKTHTCTGLCRLLGLTNYIQSFETRRPLPV